MVELDPWPYHQCGTLCVGSQDPLFFLTTAISRVSPLVSPIYIIVEVSELRARIPPVPPARTGYTGLIRRDLAFVLQKPPIEVIVHGPYILQSRCPNRISLIGVREG